MITGFLISSLLLTVCAASGAFAQKAPSDDSAWSAVVVDSLSGHVKQQKSGSTSWKHTDSGADLTGEYFLTIPKGAQIRLRWRDEAVLYVRENSRLLLTTTASQDSRPAFRHLTLFSGTAFFIQRNPAPPSDPPRFNTKVHTPNASCTLREASFVLQVNDSGRTDLGVIYGVVNTRPIGGATRRVIAAGYRMSVAANGPAGSPMILKDAQLDTLKQWIAPEVIDREIALQLQKARRNHAIISGRFEDKVTVVPLDDNSGYEGAWKPGNAVAAMLARRIGESFMGLAVEYVDSLMDDPVAFGKTLKSRYLLSGEIRRFDISQRAEITASADEYNEYRVARVDLALRMHDLIRDSTLLNISATGEISGANETRNSWETIQTYSPNSNDSLFTGSILGKALDQSLEQSAARIIKLIQK